MAPGRIALVRHGQTEWSATGRHTSITDVDLTADGVRQAHAIPGLLDGLGIDAATAWCSPRKRAQRTAAVAGIDIDEIVDDLAEWDYGTFEGRTSPEIEVENPSWSLFSDGAPDGETPQQVGLRADRVLDRARSALANGDIVLIGHGHMSRVLAARWIGLPVSGGALLDMAAAAVTVLGWYKQSPAIDHANVIPFALRNLDRAR